MKFIFRTVLLTLVLTGMGVQTAAATHKPGCTTSDGTTSDSTGTTSDGTGTTSDSYSGSASEVVADDSQGETGDTITMHGCEYLPNSNVDFHLNSEPIYLGSTQTDANGTFNVVLTIPPNAPPGRHTITAAGLAPDGTPKIESVSYTVVDPGATQRPSAAIPRTGASTLPLATASAALVAIGTILMVAARRRQPAA